MKRTEYLDRIINDEMNATPTNAAPEKSPQRLLLQSLVITGLTILGSRSINSFMPILDDPSMQSARYSFLVYAGLVVLATLLIIILNPLFFHDKPQKIIKSRSKLAWWVLLPSLLVPLLWGMEHDKIVSSTYLLFSPYEESQAVVKEVVSRGNYRPGTRRHFYDVFYEYSANEKTFSGSARSKTMFEPGQTIGIIAGKDSAGFSALANAPYQWQICSQRWVAGSIFPFIASLLLAFQALAWRGKTSESLPQN